MSTNYGKGKNYCSQDAGMYTKNTFLIIGVLLNLKIIDMEKKLHEDVTVVFTNKQGEEKKLITSYKLLIENTTDDFYDMLEPECTSSSCNNESQNFCDCGNIYEDFEIKSVIVH